MKKSFFKKTSKSIAIGKYFTERIDIVIYYKVIGEELMLSNCAEGSWEPLRLLGDQICQSLRKSTPSIHWKDCCWSWSSSPLATGVESQLTGKDPAAGKDWGLDEKRVTEHETVGWHQRLHGHEFEQIWEIVEGREARGAAVCMELRRVRHDLVTENQL